jgi:Tfp pilus assembly protein PilO
MTPNTKKFLQNFHLVFILYALWNAYGLYEEHGIQKDQIMSEREATILEISNAKKDLQDVKKFTDNLEESKKRVENVFQIIDKAQKQLPSDLSDIDILDFFSKEKKDLNIPTLQVVALQEKNESFYIIKPYDLSGESTFLQFLVLMERLSTTDRLFNIRSFEITVPQEAQKGRFQMVNFKALVDTYKYNTAHREESGVQEITGAKP